MLSARETPLLFQNVLSAQQNIFVRIAVVGSALPRSSERRQWRRSPPIGDRRKTASLASPMQIAEHLLRRVCLGAIVAELNSWHSRVRNR